MTTEIKEDRKLILKEIKEAINERRVGMGCDKKEWESILELEV